MEVRNLSHRVLTLVSYILTSAVLLLQIPGLNLAQDSPQEPTITLTPSTSSFDVIPIGNAFSINCSITIPTGYLIGTTGVPSAVIWETEKAKVQLTSNATVLTEDVRISVDYYEIDDGHAFQLTIREITSSDSGVYTCHTYVSHAIETPLILSETVYLSIGDSLTEDTPQCYIAPGKTILEDLGIMPSCFMKKNDDIDKIVQWMVQYPDGVIKTMSDSVVQNDGLNYESYHLEINAINVLDDGVKYICSVMLVGDNASVQNCTTDALDVIPGAELSSDVGAELGRLDKLDVSVGDTVSVTAKINLPAEFYISMITWSKVINGVHQLIVQDDTVSDDITDANRYSVQKIISDGADQNTMTISATKRADAGNYVCYLVISSHPDVNIGNDYLRTFQISVTNDDVSTTPEMVKEHSTQQRKRWLTSIKAATGILITIIVLVVISAYCKHYRRFQREERAKGVDNKSKVVKVVSVKKEQRKDSITLTNLATIDLDEEIT